MASSMNNWLGFSLSPQELPPQQQQPQRHHQDEISGTDVSAECFDLSSDSSVLPSLNLPAPFGIFEAFNRNNQSQDWNMKDMSMNSDINYKTNSSSDYSMLMGSSCNSQNLENQGGPKLENFLGGHSFSGRCNTISSASYGGVTGGGGAAADYNMYPNCSLQLPSEAIADNGQGSNGGVSINNNSTTTTPTTTIGLSMIKNWLRNQPTPTQPENKNDGGCGGGIGGVAKGRPTSAQTLSLSMRTESPLLLLTASGGASGGGGGGGGESTSSDNSQPKETTLDAQTGAIEAVPRKSIDTFGQRTSIYRGVTRHRWTGRYEAHLWDNSCRREGQTRKGRQVYLGGYDKEEKAARAYDLAALKYWGTTTTTNFPTSNYEKEIEEMKHMTRQEYVASLRRKSSGFSRGASIYRGVTRHHQHGRWQARIGRVAGNKDLYLGTFSTQEEAAEAYDIAAIKFRGLNAVTNFDMSRYDVKSILESSTLPIGGAAKRLKDAADKADQLNMTTMSMHNNNTHLLDDNNLLNSHLSLTDHGITNAAVYGDGWPTIAFQQAQPYSSTMHYHPYGIGQQQQRATMPVWCKQEQEQDQDHQDDLNQLQLGNNTHNFFHHPTSALHNLMSLDEHSSAGSNSLVYSGGGDSNGGGGFVMPIATVISQEGNNTTAHGFGDNENIFGVMPDPYHGRNLYYLSQHQQSLSGGGGAVKASVYEYDHHHHHHQIQGTSCNNWIPTAVPTLAPARSNNMAVCHGAQTFTVWNDT
ncbi:unnamed protein product [Camellia sinensis]